MVRGGTACSFNLKIKGELFYSILLLPLIPFSKLNIVANEYHLNVYNLSKVWEYNTSRLIFNTET